MLLDAARSQLLVVDVQERLVPALNASESMLRNLGVLLAASARLGVPATLTEQYPKGLGRTLAAVREAAPAAVVLEKIAFSAAGDEAAAERVGGLRGQGRDQLVICGAEAHVCVLQSALGFRTGGPVAVVGDAVASRRESDRAAATARLLHAGCHWVTTEMVLFEWLGRAGTEDFRALAPLIKGQTSTPEGKAKFSDFGDSLAVKTQICSMIALRIKRMNWVQRETAWRIGATPPDISRIMQGDAKGFSLERLLNYAQGAGINVQLQLDDRT